MEQLLKLDQHQMQILEEALHRRICSVCPDRNLHGRSDLDAEHEAPLFGNLPRVVQCLSQVHSDKIDDYITAMRKNICPKCIHQELDGSCKWREEVRCVLDSYLMLVVETIEDVQRVILAEASGTGHVGIKGV